MDDYPGGLRGKLQIFELKLLYAMGISKRYQNHYNQTDSLIVKLGVGFLCLIGKLFSLRWLINTYSKISQKYNHRSCSECFASNISIIFLSKTVCIKEWFIGKAEIPIRDRLFFAPSGYEKLLQYYFGDYMQLPLEENRVPDHVETFNDIVINDRVR